MDREDLISIKKVEIMEYERIFNAYQGRWKNYGKRHLEELRAELAALEQEDAEDSSKTS